MHVADPLRAHDPTHLGGYELRGRLGEGGQGVVYSAVGATGDLVAIKWLRPDMAGDPVMVQRFVREVSAAERVAPFCTAQVLGTGVEQDRPFIVSEYIDGPSLQKVVKESGPRTGAALHRLAVGTATALAAIHQAGIVHRDFKPANVLIAPDGPRVIDFGVARAMDVSMTLSSGPMGTPAFMAPEQIHGSPTSPATDMFAWAGTMIYAARGAPAFGGDSLPSVINRVLNLEPDLSDLSALDDRLLDLVRDCLDKDPARRPSAEQVIFGLIQHSPATPVTLGEAAAAASEHSPPPAAGWISPGAVPGNAPRMAGAGRSLPGTLTTREPSLPSAPGRPPGGGRRGLLIGGAAAAAAVLVVALMLVPLEESPATRPTNAAASSPGSTPASSPSPSLGPTAVPTTDVTKRPLSGSDGLGVYEHPGDPIRLYSYSAKKTESSEWAYYARDRQNGFLEYPDSLYAETSPNGRYLARIGTAYTSEGYDSVEIVDLVSGGKAVVRTVKDPLQTGLQLWSRDSTRLLLNIAREASDKTWKNVGFAIVTVGDPKARVVMSDTAVGDGGYGWAGTGRGVVAVMDVGGGSHLRFFSVEGEQEREIRGVGKPPSGMDLFSPSGRQFVTGCPKGSDSQMFCVWNTGTGAEVRRFTADCADLLGWYDETHVYCWTNETDASGKSLIQVFDLNGKRVRRLLEVADRDLLSPTFSLKPVVS